MAQRNAVGTRSVHAPPRYLNTVAPTRMAKALQQSSEGHVRRQLRAALQSTGEWGQGAHLVAEPRQEVVDPHGGTCAPVEQQERVSTGWLRVWCVGGVLSAIKITQAAWGSAAWEVCAAPQRGSCAEAWSHPHRHAACAGSTSVGRWYAQVSGCGVCWQARSRGGDTHLV